MVTSKRKILARGALLLSCLSMGVAYSGCAQDVGTIDRTRPDKLKKSIFSGNDEWYYGQTVVGTDFQSSHGLPVGFKSPLKRIRWTITEDTLFAYSTTEPAIGVDNGLQDPKDRRLGVVAAFPIISHFDIQRGYNSSTGQLSNVVEENGSDRLWYDREYMRVDWSGNRIGGVGLFESGIGKMSAVNRTVPSSDSSADYDRARISDDYIDVVTEYYFEPDPISCALGLGRETYMNCEAGPVKIRSAFLKVPKKRKFEPVPYFDYEELKDDNGQPLKVANLQFHQVECTPDIKRSSYRNGESLNQDACLDTAKFDLFNRFGFFRTERTIYDPRRGSKYLAEKRYFANSWNIWQTAYDDKGNLLPMEDRKPKQIVYYLNVDFPEDKPYTEAWKALEQDWNKVFLDTVKLTHNIVDLKGDSVYNWMSALINKMDKIDKKVYDEVSGMVDVENITPRLGLDGNGEVIEGSPLFYAGKAIEAMKTNGGAAWRVLCSNGLFTASLGLGSSASACESSDVDQLVAKIKAAIGKEATTYASSVVAGTSSWDLANLPLTQSLLLLARTYLMTPVNKQLPQAKAADVKKYELAVRRSISANKYRKEIPRTTFQSGNEAVKKLVAASNGGDERMFRIETNSCSPVKLMQWKSQYGDINEDVQSLFSGQTVDSLRKLTRKSKLEFCAKLEWATRNEQGDRRFDWQREGDLRYSFVSMTPETVPWLGYGPAFADPQTGEIISAAANFAGEAVDGYAAIAADFIMYFDGRISEDELITGDYVTKELHKLAAVDGTTSLTKLRPGQLGEVPAGERQALSSSSRRGPEALRDLYAKAGWGENGPVVAANESSAPLSKPELQKKVAELAKSLRTSNISSKAQTLEYRRFLKAQDQKIKQIADVSTDPKVVAAHLTSPEYAAMLDALGKARYGDRELTQDERDSIIAEVASPVLALRREDARSRELASRNFYPVEALEQGLGTAISYQGAVEYFKNKSRKEIEDYFKKGVFFGTQVHEVGHTLGLRHNFIGSYDAINYQPAFWDVKAAGYNDPAIADTPYLSAEQLEQITGEKPPGTTDYFNRAAYRYSSVMDYTVGFDSGVPGVGTYDEAAIQFVYAKRIQVFDDSVDWDPLKTLFIDKLFIDYDNFPLLFLSNRFLTGGQENTLPYLGGFFPLLYDLGAFSSVHDKDEVRKEYFPAAIKLMTQARRWVTVDEAKQDFKDQLKRRAEVFTDMLKKKPDGVLGEGDLKKEVLNFLNKEPRLNLVPYKFCTDDYRGVELGCDVFDWGASQDEILQYKIDQFETLKNRNRYNHGISNQLFQNYRRYYFGLSKLLYSVQQPFFYYANVVVAKGLNWFNATKDYQHASLRGLNYIAQTFAQPEPDKYCPFDSENPGNLTPAKPDLYVAFSEITDAKGNVVGCDNPLIITKNEGVAYSYKIADTYNLQLERLPGYIDKDLAIKYMFLVTGTYLNQELSNDATSDKGSFWTAFQDQVYDFLRGVVLSDPKGYAGGVDVSSGTPKYVPPQMVSYADLEAYDDNKKPAPNPEKALPRVDVFANFTMGYDALLYSLILNNTFLDDQADAVQYMKVCASNDECDNIYLDIDNSFTGTVTSPDGTTEKYKDGRKLVSYELTEPTDVGATIATITDAPSTTYRTASGITVKTFIHPDLPIIFRAPIGRDGKSITGELIDKLNDFVYGAKEPSYAAVLSRGDKKEATGYYIYKRNDYENFMRNEPAGEEGYKDKKKSFERARRLMEFYVSKLNIIRDIMKKTRGLY